MAMQLGERIRLERLAKKYSQEYMAWSLEISQAAYSKIERNETEISLNRLFEIAEVLEISAYVLMPKPKYATGLGQAYFWRALNKLRSYFNPPSDSIQH